MVFEVVKFVATTRLRAKRDAGEATPAKDHEKGNRFAGCKRFPSFIAVGEEKDRFYSVEFSFFSLLRSAFPAQPCACGQLGVNAALLDELRVGAALENAVFADDHDFIRAADGGQAVGDHQRCAPLGETIKRGLNLALGGGIQRAGRLVQNEHTRVF